MMCKMWASPGQALLSISLHTVLQPVRPVQLMKCVEGRRQDNAYLDFLNELFTTKQLECEKSDFQAIMS